MSEVITKKQTIPWGEVGYITYKRTYARPLKDGSEEFEDTIERELKGIIKQLKLELTEEEQEFYRHMRMNLLGSPAGRFMWQLGTKTVDKLGLASLQNCAGVAVASAIRPSDWTMDMLMLGSGVGFNIQKEFIYGLKKLPRKKVKIVRQDDASADHIVADTREGWVKLLSKVLKAHFYGTGGFSYSVQLVRSKDAPIAGFGGVSSGPEILCKMLAVISEILNNAVGRKLRPIEALDIKNIIGMIVVAGNVRRSAEIAIGDYDDLEFLKAKRWDLGVPNWRAMSNNSIAVPPNFKDIPEEYWETYEQGEAYGLINFPLARSCGRLGETQYPDAGIVVFNPCGEQGLWDYETCCLAEVFLPAIKTRKMFYKVLEMLYKVCKHSLRLPCHHPETEKVVHDNMRMGIGPTGLMMCSEEQLSWLDGGYKFLRKLDKEYSAKMGWPESIKLTTVKPSGTQALLRGVTPGAHANPAGPYYIRRIQMSSSSPLVQVCKDHGYEVEYRKNFDATDDRTTVVVSFPCKVPEGTPIAGDLDPIDHLEFVKRLQTEWSDNSVSVTVNYRKEDLPRIRKYLEENFSENFKTLSFLCYNDHGFAQAPYETITKEEYLEMKARTTPITSLETVDESIVGIEECEGGACPVK
jgi:hypothetical protein